ncbi:MFS transporter [Xaviernesmea oryzae]|uniref:Bcr/CflA family efflux transporter n=2 Tax=Xaviernesmea oryzae TaxID=464029 RepID=A0A1Q9AU63_9HYPH|nr:MFS transporter [Xaviernesmea oryzae]
MQPAKRSARYESFLIFLAPLINSVAGIAIDLYAPSLPAIGREFSVSAEMMQNTISITLISYAVGQIFFGFMADARGRRPSIIFGLSVFVAGSLLAVVATSIETLMFARALQGFAIGACQVVARAVLVDTVKGDRFHVAIIYLSVAFGLGPVIAPFIGGHIEENLGWRWNFALYAVYGVAVLATAFFGLRETLASTARRSIGTTLKGYLSIIVHPRFLAAVTLLSASFTTFLIWNVIGPYILQDRLGHGPAFFGTTALMVGVAYLGATLVNRALVSTFDNQTRLIGGLALFAIGTIVTALGGASIQLPFVLSGTIIVACAQGFIFSNSMSVSMSLFPDRAGAAASLQGCLMLVGGSIATVIINSLPITSSLSISTIFAALMIVAFVGYAGIRRTGS